MLGKKIKIFFNYNINSQGWAFSKKKQGASEGVATKSDPTYGKMCPFKKYTNNKTQSKPYHKYNHHTWIMWNRREKVFIPTFFKLYIP
jgi:hypothetical protein